MLTSSTMGGWRSWRRRSFEAFRSLADIVPRPGYLATGEERAWGRRLAKRFGVESGHYDEKTFHATGHEVPALVFDHDSLKPEKLDAGLDGLFVDVDVARGDSLVGFGWALADHLVKLV